MRVVVVGDVGVVDRMIHIGDEAMFGTFVDAMRRRGQTDVVAVSSAPQETAERYAVEAVERIGFAGLDRAQGETRLALCSATAEGGAGLLRGDDSAHPVVQAVRHTDGVVIAGGGNLASTWPLHVLERAAVGRIAAAAGVPVVVTGQTLGPDLHGRDAELVRELLTSARLVGTREPASSALAAELGARSNGLVGTVDDAAFLDQARGPSPVERPYCLVTVAVHVGGADAGLFAAAIAALVDDVTAETGLHPVFAAHWGSLDPALVRGDDIMHERILSRMHGVGRRLALRGPSESAALARGASLVVTTRYHPAVFAAAARVPVLAVAVDDYTRVKLTGALGAFGQGDVLNAADLLAGAGAAHARLVWADREAARERAAAVAPDRRRAKEAWWDRVRGVLEAGRTSGTSQPTRLFR